MGKTEKRNTGNFAKILGILCAFKSPKFPDYKDQGCCTICSEISQFFFSLRG